MKIVKTIITLAVSSMPGFAADMPERSRTGSPAATAPASPALVAPQQIRGRVAVIDGRTLWFPHAERRVRLAEIDACDVPQWAFDPKWTDRNRIKAPPPVPCGPLSKAWLKRLVGNSTVTCRITEIHADGVPAGNCQAGRKDLGYEMLLVGWARLATPWPSNARYFAAQKHAVAARYGIWGTYVLDMEEWRRKAVDRTAGRRPIADFNLLSERESEFTPPFADARQRPKRTDR